jgi:sugar phosphate isomerase/epimerase
VQFGGADVCKTLSKLKGRVGCVHLKDFATVYNSEKQEFLGKFAPVGDGNLDFKGIIQTLKESGTEYYLVEQDDAVNYPDCLAQVKRSIDYLTKEFN